MGNRQAVSKKVQQEKWGKSIVEQLSKDLQTEFPGIRGFSARNIWNMKSFYEFYTENEKLQPLVAEIGWVQNYLILEKCKDKPKIEYYLRKTKEMGWSKADLIDKINKNHFENQALAQNNFAVTVSPLAATTSKIRRSQSFRLKQTRMIILIDKKKYSIAL